MRMHANERKSWYLILLSIRVLTLAEINGCTGSRLYCATSPVVERPVPPRSADAALVREGCQPGATGEQRCDEQSCTADTGTDACRPSELG